MKKKNLYIIILLAAIFGLALFFFFNQKTIIPEETFVNFYYDYMIAQDSLGSDIKTSKNIRAKLFTKYGITEKDYATTVGYYKEEPVRWDSLFTKVMKKMEGTKNLK